MGQPFVPRKMPEHVHPLVRRLFAEMNERQCSAYRLARRSGVGHTTIKNWHGHMAPSVPNLEAALNVLGLQLQIVEIPENKGA